MPARDKLLPMDFINFVILDLLLGDALSCRDAYTYIPANREMARFTNR
jgi:hypothetical protein